jgi:hypothetical protein
MLPEECSHGEVEWEPANLNYNSDGVAEVAQQGRCNECKALVERSVDLATAEVYVIPEN